MTGLSYLVWLYTEQSVSTVELHLSRIFTYGIRIRVWDSILISKQKVIQLSGQLPGNGGVNYDRWESSVQWSLTYSDLNYPDYSIIRTHVWDLTNWNIHIESDSFIRIFSYPDSWLGNEGVRISEAPLYMHFTFAQDRIIQIFLLNWSVIDHCAMGIIN